MHICEKCMKVSGALFVVVGILFLLQDLKVWSFWGISWFTVVFLLFGIGHFGSASCKDCKAMRK